MHVTALKARYHSPLNVASNAITAAPSSHGGGAVTRMGAEGIIAYEGSIGRNLQEKACYSLRI